MKKKREVAEPQGQALAKMTRRYVKKTKEEEKR